MQQISSITMSELQDATSPTYLRHEERTRALRDPTLLRCFANTIIMRVPSSKFDENSTYWHQYIMLEDLKGLVKHNGWSLEEAVRYCIEEGDVHIYCDCPAHLYWGDKYYATAGGYTYGGYRETRAPTRNNVNAENLLCKHTDKAFRYLQSHIEEVTTWFKEYYNVSLKKSPETPASEVHEKPVDIPNKPRYTSRSSNENDVELAYEDEETDTVYIPDENEREEINQVVEEEKEEEQFQEDRAEVEAENDSLPDDSILEEDTAIIEDSNDEEGLV